MILVDTSVWINHLRRSDEDLSALLEAGLVFTHPMVIGELSCGNLKNRAEVLANLKMLPVPAPARDEEVLALLERHQLFGKGMGWIDAHLLASTLITRCGLWTRDQMLAGIATGLEVPHQVLSGDVWRPRM